MADAEAYIQTSDGNRLSTLDPDSDIFMLLVSLMIDEYASLSELGPDAELKGKIQTCFLECQEDLSQVRLHASPGVDTSLSRSESKAIIFYLGQFKSTLLSTAVN